MFPRVAYLHHRRGVAKSLSSHHKEVISPFIGGRPDAAGTSTVLFPERRGLCRHYAKYAPLRRSFLNDNEFKGGSHNSFQNQYVHFSSIPRRDEDELQLQDNDDDEVDSSNQINITNEGDIVEDEFNYTPEKLKELKDERKKMHDEKYQMAAKKRELAHRKILAEELMRIFATNDDLFHATLEELDISITGSNNVSEYRQFYLDSLPSFGVLLYEDPEANEQSFHQLGLTSGEVLNLLEQFSNGGFRDSVFSKKYRSMFAALKKIEELETSIQRYKEKELRQLEKVRREESILKRMESGASTTDLLPFLLESDFDKSDETSEIESNNNQTASSAEGNDNILLFKLESALSQLASGKSDIETAEQIILKQRNKVNNARIAAESTNNRVKRAQEILDELELPLSDDEFQSVSSLIMRVSLRLTPALAKYITNRHSDFAKYRQLEQHTDLTRPQEWYPHARLDKRKIIFHAGPTNSGKTYHALQRLKEAKKGMYLAPLRLLAAEVYENLTADGIYTDLITGQEFREVPFSTHRASTVELACIDQDYDVVVIDEIQMLCDSFRGFAWTRALMGVRCKEIHVCGGAEARDIVEKICQMCGDDLEVKEYKRFGELRVQEKSLADSTTAKGSYAKVQPGDCVVAFSKQDLFAIRREIENSTPYKCCIIYGTLPPEIRAEQARRFNDPNSEYQVLVASDAVGMGLNLSIRRVIFNSMFKNNGEKIVQLDHSLVKQIAGRAGRRNSPYPHGEVTCRDPFDMKHLRKCMESEVPPVKKAGLIPTSSHIGLFNDLLNEYGASHDESELHKTLRQFSEMATLQGDFFLCRKKSMEIVSRWLTDIPMTAPEKFMLCMSPVNEGCVRSKNVLLRYVQKYVSGEVPGLHRTMRPRAASSFQHLAELCSIHHEIELFLWLQTKLPSNAVEQLTALSLKESTIALINEGLYKADKLSLNHDYISKDVRVKKMWAQEMKAAKSNQDVFL